MGIRCSFRKAALSACILMISSKAGAQEAGEAYGTAEGAPKAGKVTGVLTDRLQRSHLKAWESIMEIVLARDGQGRPAHPVLYGLYYQADTSGYEIQIELSTERSILRAVGLCRIERPADRTPKEVVLIRLNLGMIDRAMASELTRRADGFVPFSRLRKRERYAEVLGHELAHVVRLVTHPDYMRLYRERQALAAAGSQDYQAIGTLTSAIEQPAEAAEVQIWRELAGGLNNRPRLYGTIDDRWPLRRNGRVVEGGGLENR